MKRSTGYEAIYTAGVPVHAASVEAHIIVVDSRGNERLENVYGTELDAGAARGVKWSNREIVDWGNIWTVYAMNRFPTKPSAVFLALVLIGYRRSSSA